MADAQKNLFTVDLTNNPELAALFAGKEPGDMCEVTTKLQTVENDGKTFTAVIKKISKDYEGEEAEVVPTAEEPVAITVMPMPETEKEYA